MRAFSGCVGAANRVQYGSGRLYILATASQAKQKIKELRLFLRAEGCKQIFFAGAGLRHDGVQFPDPLIGGQQRLRPPVARHGFATHKTALFQIVDDGHHARPLDSQLPRNIALGDLRAVNDQGQNRHGTW